MEKRSDISRDSFRPEQGYTSVRLQQGRPQLDADWNEQMDLQLQRESTARFDLLGPAVSAAKNPLETQRTYNGFRVDMDLGPLGPTRVSIRGGRTYVDGHLIEAEGSFDFTQQPFCPNLKLPTFGPPSASPPASLWIVYLETFEREVTALDDSVLREVALGIPDTTTRTQQAWQVRFVEIPAAHPLHSRLTPDLLRLTKQEQPTFLSLQTVAEQPSLASLSPGPFTPTFVGSPAVERLPGQLQARFIDQGATLENRLYRVEVTAASDSAVSIRWSRDNGAVVAPLLRLAFPAGGGQSVVLSRPAVGDASVFAKGQWLEITTPGSELRGDPPQYRRIRSQGVFEAGELTVPIEGSIALDSFLQNEGGIRVRLWNSASDQSTYPLSMPLKDTDEGPRASDFFPLEDGIEVQLVLPGQSDDSLEQRSFRFAPGQYWQVPMRAALGGIDWPLNTPRSAQETRHSYVVLGAALALASNPNRPQDRAWRYVNLLPSAISSLPVLERNIQKVSQNITAMLQERIGPLEGTIFRIRTTSGSILPVFNTTSTERPVELTPNLSGAFDRAGFITFLYLLDGTHTAFLNGGPLNGAPPQALSPQGPVRQLTLFLRVPVSTNEVRLNMRILAVYVRDRTEGELSVPSSVVAGAPFAPTVPRGL